MGSRSRRQPEPRCGVSAPRWRAGHRVLTRHGARCRSVLNPRCRGVWAPSANGFSTSPVKRSATAGAHTRRHRTRWRTSRRFFATCFRLGPHSIAYLCLFERLPIKRTVEGGPSCGRERSGRGCRAGSRPPSVASPAIARARSVPRAMPRPTPTARSGGGSGRWWRSCLPPWCRSLAPIAVSGG